MKRFKLIIAGGKTGGHLFPGIAVAQAMERLCLEKRKKAQLLFVGTDTPFEIKTLNAYGYAHKAIYSKPIKGGSPIKKLVSVSIILISLFQSFKILKTTQPDFVLGVGGFSSFAVVLAARLLGIPTAIQEQNAIPGMTNRILSRFAQTIFTSFDPTLGLVKNPKVCFTGNPVRKPDSIEPATRTFDLDPHRITLLITGGSQGAASINTAVVDAFEKMGDPAQFNIIHQTGTAQEEQIRAAYKKLKIQAIVRAFFTDMPNLTKKADLIIARAGAGTLSELAVLGKPAILIPFPHAADDHQTVNARAMVENKAAVLIADKDLTGRVLQQQIKDLIQYRSRLENMGLAMKSMARPNADTDIATHILNTKEYKG